MSDIIIKSLLDADTKKGNREVIIDYLVSEPGTVILNREQEELLEKWQFADDQIRTNRYTTSEIAKLLMRKYNKSIAQAWRYLNDARFVFGSSLKSTKNYLLAVHADRIELAMQMCLKSGDFKSYAALCREYTSAVKELPDDNKVNVAAPMAVFLIQSTSIDKVMDVPISDDEAERIANKKIGESIPFTETIS